MMLLFQSSKENFALVHPFKKMMRCSFLLLLQKLDERRAKTSFQLKTSKLWITTKALDDKERCKWACHEKKQCRCSPRCSMQWNSKKMVKNYSEYQNHWSLMSLNALCPVHLRHFSVGRVGTNSVASVFTFGCLQILNVNRFEIWSQAS